LVGTGYHSDGLKDGNHWARGNHPGFPNVLHRWRQLFNAIAAPSTDALKRSSWYRKRATRSARSVGPRWNPGQRLPTFPPTSLLSVRQRSTVRSKAASFGSPFLIGWALNLCCPTQTDSHRGIARSGPKLTPPSIVSSLVALCISVASFESVSGLFRPGSLHGLKQSASCRNDQFIWDAAISSEPSSPPRWRDLGPSHRPASFQPASHRSKMTCHIIGHDGKITRFRAFVCNNDADTTIWAKQMVDGHDVLSFGAATAS
jgi:hypothetical protein